MKRTIVLLVLICGLVTILSSCGKGYKVRFTNYYTEEMDSVIVGNNKIVYAKIDPEATTEYYSLSKGNYPILFISKTKKKFSSSISIPKTGTGNRTIQIDGIAQVAILEE